MQVRNEDPNCAIFHPMYEAMLDACPAIAKATK